ncbi:SDR family oxidoreductase [Kineosporia babensis]|uniref:SDR family oxidoreductase n=1 Tax=Kineosporia babensis TaxID=499548 RepID=A0A9X1NHV8_9ACTN|nr:SDR family oxidoreductase [Kineosporia babensis]MCD5314071.1 SDR family oxidoreductase [Kineosporia babensis]
MSTLILGATGQLGRLLLADLRKRGVEASAITAAGRNQDVLSALAAEGYRTATVELSDAQQVAAAVDGHDRVVLISGLDPDRVQQHRNVVDAARAAGVQHLVYSSGIRADDPSWMLGADHRATEDAIKDAGLTYTFLRNGWYIENYLTSLASARESGVFAAAVGEARVAAAGRRDYAEALGAVIAGQGHEGRTYTLAGDQDFTYADIAAAMGEVLGRPVVYQAIAPAQYPQILVAAGMDEQTAGFLTALDQNIAAGVLAHAGDDLSRLIGHPTMSLVEGLRQ